MYSLGDETVSVFSEWLVPCATLSVTKLGGNRSYIQVSKRSLKLHRLFLGGTEHGKTVKEYRNRMSDTTVLDDLKWLKDGQWNALMPESAVGNRGYSTREARQRRLALPETITITTPTYGDVEIITMSGCFESAWSWFLHRAHACELGIYSQGNVVATRRLPRATSETQQALRCKERASPRRA